MLTKKTDLHPTSPQNRLSSLLFSHPPPPGRPRHHGWLWDLVKSFVLGGTIAASIGYTANFLSPVVAAIFWAFPLSLLPAVYYLIDRGRTSKYVANFVLTTTYALIILFITTMALGYFYKGQKNPSFWPPVLKALLIYVVLGISYYWIIKHFNLESYFD